MQQQKQNTSEEKIKLVQAAAKLIKEDIKAIESHAKREVGLLSNAASAVYQIL